MTLIIGGVGQGKLDYVLKKTGLSAADLAYDPEAAQKKPIFVGLADWLRAQPEADVDALAERNPDLIVICDELGCGVVPLGREERIWREAVGRACCRLAQRAQRVERIFCGLPMVLKGEGIWNSF